MRKPAHHSVSASMSDSQRITSPPVEPCLVPHARGADRAGRGAAGVPARRSLADLSAVELGDRAGGVDHRDDERPGQVLVATVAVDAEALQATPELPRPALVWRLGRRSPRVRLA